MRIATAFRALPLLAICGGTFAQNQGPSLQETTEFIVENMRGASFSLPTRMYDRELFPGFWHDPHPLTVRPGSDGNVTISGNSVPNIGQCKGTVRLDFSVRDVELDLKPNEMMFAVKCAGPACIKTTIDVEPGSCVGRARRVESELGGTWRLDQVDVKLSGSHAASMKRAFSHYQTLVGGKKKSLF